MLRLESGRLLVLFGSFRFIESQRRRWKKKTEDEEGEQSSASPNRERQHLSLSLDVSLPLFVSARPLFNPLLSPAARSGVVAARVVTETRSTSERGHTLLPPQKTNHPSAAAD